MWSRLGISVEFSAVAGAVLTCPVLGVGNRVRRTQFSQENAELIVESIDERIIMITGLSKKRVKQARSRTGPV